MTTTLNTFENVSGTINLRALLGEFMPARDVNDLLVRLYRDPYSTHTAPVWASRSWVEVSIPYQSGRFRVRICRAR